MSASIEDILKLLDERNLEDLLVYLKRFPSAIRELEDSGVSTLHLALSDRSCSVAFVKILLDYGADPDLESKNFIPLYSALNCLDRVGIIRALVEGGARVIQSECYILTAAIIRNSELEVIKLLLSAGADLIRSDILGECPLFHAMELFNISYFRSLLDLQAVDINTIRNRRKDSLLHSVLSKEGCTTDFVKFLIHRGIRVDLVDKCKNTPLHVMVRKWKCHPDVVDILLRSGSLVNVCNQKGESPLDIAMRKNRNTDIIQMLLKYCLLEYPVLDDIADSRINELKDMFSKYAIDCKYEVRKMNSENVGNGRTLFQFLHAYSGSQMTRTVEEGFNVDQLLQILADKRYPLYSRVISSKLERSLLKEKLTECDIFTFVEDSSDIGCVREKFSLSNDCVHILANFLDDNDLLNMIMVYFK